MSQLSKEEINKLLIGEETPPVTESSGTIANTLTKETDDIEIQTHPQGKTQTDSSPINGYAGEGASEARGRGNGVNSSLSSDSPQGKDSDIAPADSAAAESYLLDEILNKTIVFDSPIEMLATYDTNIREGGITLHPWQAEIGTFFGQVVASINNPLKFALCASNGSGKDSFVIAPLAVWFILCKLKSRVVITSSSGVQLTAQTETYIRNLCETINAYHGEKIFKINQRYIRCLWTGSEIRMYATDEPGKAEGYHPIEPNAPFLIIVNEAKSVSEEIFGAISRCTGFSHKVYVSSPGEPKGSFYYAFNNWPYHKRVTSYDCTHIPTSEIESDKQELGEHSALFRSKHLALFTTVGGLVLITEDAINKCKLSNPARIGAAWPKRVGIDLAAGGDECVIAIWQGNARIYQYCFVERDTTISADIIDRELTSQGIPKDSAYIRADDGGVGRGIIDNLIRKGWQIARVLNQSPAFDKRMFGNKGAEMWFKFTRLVQECFLILPYEDTKFIEQLAGRHYRQTEGGNNRIFLQSKPEAKSHGYPSPDRADASVLANADVTIEMMLTANVGQTVDTAAQHNNTNRFVPTVKELVQEHDSMKFAERPSEAPFNIPQHLESAFANYSQVTRNNIPSRSANGSLLSLFG